MAIPDYQSVVLSLLKFVATSGRISLRDAVGKVCKEFASTDAEIVQMLPIGSQ